MSAHLDEFIMYDTVKYTTKEDVPYKNHSRTQEESQYSKRRVKMFHDYFMDFFYGN